MIPKNKKKPENIFLKSFKLQQVQLWPFIYKQQTLMPWNCFFGAPWEPPYEASCSRVCVNAGVRSVCFRMHVKLKTLDQPVCLQGSTMELLLHPIREAG